MSSKDRRSGTDDEMRDEFLEPPTGGSKVVSTTSYQGPIPPVEMMAEFDAVIPNGADRIMKMAERQQEHEIAERTHINRVVGKVVVRAQMFQFSLLFAMIACGVFLIHEQLIVFGTIVISPALVLALVSAWKTFVQRK